MLVGDTGRRRGDREKGKTRRGEGKEEEPRRGVKRLTPKQRKNVVAKERKESLLLFSRECSRFGRWWSQ